MADRFWFRDPDGTLTEIVGRIETGTLDLGENAEEGSVAGSQVIIRDPNMDFTIGGHRIFAWQVTDIADANNDFVYVGYTAARKIVRDEKGTGRNWEVELVDINSVLPRKILTQPTANRSAETDVARVTWWEGTEDGALIDDDRYLLAAGAVSMDAADYRGQYGFDLIRDAAEHTGKNFYVTYFGDIDMGAANPWGAFSLWYGDPAATDYASTFRLTNIPADVDSTTLIVVSAETNLDPHRVFSGIYLPYKSSFVFVEREEAATAFALGGRDAVMPAVNVSSKAKALTRANRYATDASTEDERITVVYRVPRADVNGIRPGQRVQVKFQHIPSVSSAYTYCRVLNRRITEPNTRQFEVTVELSPPSEPATGAGADVYGVLRQSQGPNSNVVYWSFVGDAPEAGYPTQPTVGLIVEVEDLTPPNGGWPYTGWKSTGTGTVDVSFFATTAGVLIDNTVYSITYAIRKNGVVVASEAVNVSGFLQFHSHQQLVTKAALAVVPNDVIDATIVCIPPTMPFFRTPVGTGQNGERLEITGGSLV